MPDILNPVLSSRSIWTLDQMRSRVREMTLLRSTAYLPNTEIDRSLNDAQRQIARRWKGFKATITTGTTATTAEYNLPQPAASRCLQIEELYHQNERLPHVSQEAMDRSYSQWRTHQGTPFNWMARGHSAYRLYPTPSVTDTDAVQIIYAALPPEVSAPEDLFYIPHGMDDALVAYACYMASLKDKTGEGRTRTEDFFRLWQIGLKEADLSRDTAVEDVVVMGENGLSGGPRFGVYVPPYTTITG